MSALGGYSRTSFWMTEPARLAVDGGLATPISPARLESVSILFMNWATGRLLFSIIIKVLGAEAHQLCAGVHSRLTEPPIRLASTASTTMAEALRGRPRRCKASTGAVRRS